MTLANESLELLKTDTEGRVWTGPERREGLLDEFERSGLSGMRFAARYGLKYPTFASWVARRRRERMELKVDEEAGTSPAPDAGRRPVAPACAVRWLEAVPEDGAVAGAHVSAAPARGVILHLPGGVRMEVAHADQAALAAALMLALGAGAAPAPRGGGGGGTAALRLQPSSLSPAPSC